MHRATSGAVSILTTSPSVWRGRASSSVGCCEALIEVEHAVPEAGPLVDALDRLLERARDLVGAYDQPELPLAS